jgi:aarF domain-containing kinase
MSGYPPLFSSRQLLKPRIPLSFTCQKRCFTTARSFARPATPSFFHAARRAFNKAPVVFTAVVVAAAVPLVKQKSNDAALGDEEESNETLETLLLNQSEDERKEQAYGVNKERHLIYRIFKHINVAFVKYVYEPIATGLRFIQLVFIFVPVTATVPIIFLGSRDEEHDNERSGTLWWYALLVKQMERAGPTFIKVCHLGDPY